MYIGILGDENIGTDPHVHHVAPFSSIVDVGYIYDIGETNRIVKRADALLIICTNPEYASHIHNIRPVGRTVPRRIVVLGSNPEQYPEIKAAAEFIDAHFFPIPTPFEHIRPVLEAAS